MLQFLGSRTRRTGSEEAHWRAGAGPERDVGTVDAERRGGTHAGNRLPTGDAVQPQQQKGTPVLRQPGGRQPQQEAEGAAMAGSARNGRESADSGAPWRRRRRSKPGGSPCVVGHKSRGSAGAGFRPESTASPLDAVISSVASCGDLGIPRGPQSQREVPIGNWFGRRVAAGRARHPWRVGARVACARVACARWASAGALGVAAVGSWHAPQ